MQVIRFYGIQGDDIHVLAKFVTKNDVLESKIYEYAQFLVIGIHSAGDVVDFLNSKFLDLSELMQNQGFSPVDILDPEDHDSQCAKTYDIAVDSDSKVIKMLTFSIQASDTAPFYDKRLVDTKTYGMLS
jgi:UDP-N-acetyl-D-mannosaminuronate dehydrogenase